MTIYKINASRPVPQTNTSTTKFVFVWRAIIASTAPVANAILTKYTIYTMVLVNKNVHKTKPMMPSHRDVYPSVERTSN